MVTTLPINRIKAPAINPMPAILPKVQLEKPLQAIVCMTMPTSILAGEVSTFLKDFNKTSTDRDNYFQLKTNPETGKPFEADVFQKAAAMNLYLGNDVLVTAPTGTGKTAIAEYIITKNLLEGKRTFYTTPLKALSNEKYRDFCKIYGKDNVGILTGDTKVNSDAPIIIMTTEVYRNMTASEQFNLDDPNREMLKDTLKTVIFDELQYLGDVDRGGVWEQSIMFTPKDVQILSLSATIGNNEEINNWIASTKGRKGVSAGVNNTIDEHYLPNRSLTKETVLINVPSENRHVPLTFEQFQAVPEIKEVKGHGHSRKKQIQARKKGLQMVNTIYAKPASQTYKDLTKELNHKGRLPAIYFVFSKKEGRKLLTGLSEEGELLTTKEERTEIDKIIKKYKNKGTYLGETLNEDALFKGYAVHNSGLLPSQKQLVEELFQKKLIKVVIATETLSAGINMPAKTTVISSPRKPSSTPDDGPDHKVYHSPNGFHQMAGRAGRRGIDTEGFCYVLACNDKQRAFYDSLIKQPSNPLSSSMDIDFAFIANYTSEYLNEDMLRNTLSKSLYVNDKRGGINESKLEELMKKYRIRRRILDKEGYIDQNGHLTVKGQLIKALSGYEQVPVINLISNKALANLDAVEIAAIVSGLANIEYDTKDGGKEEKEFYTGGSTNPDFYDVLEETFFDVKNYERNTSALYPNRALNINGDIVGNVLRWADLNAHHGNSRRNWRDLYYYGKMRNAVRDEGSLFREITGTVDLMKQLADIAKIGETYSETESDREYYSTLAEKLNKGIDLLQREPVTDDNV